MSSSSRVLRKLGLLAAVGTVAAGGVWQTASWADPQLQIAGDSSSATVLTHPRSAEDRGSSPYRPQAAPAVKANSPVDLSSAYRPGGNVSGANQAAVVGQPLAVPPTAAPLDAPPIPAQLPLPAEQAVGVDIASGFRPVSPEVGSEPAPPVATGEVNVPAPETQQIPAANVPETNSGIPDATAEEQASAAPTAEAEAAVAEAVPGETTASADADQAPCEATGKPSLLEAMLAGSHCENSDCEATASVDRAQRVKKCFHMLGIADDSVGGPIASQAAPSPQGQLEVAVDETNLYPATGAPPLIHDENVFPASHAPPGPWGDAQPRLIQVAQRGDPFVDDPPRQLPNGHFEVIEEENKALEVRVRRSLLLRTPFDIYRTAVVDSAICDVVQFTPREVSIVGKSSGSTNVTFWFEDGNHRPVTYVVRVIPDLEEKSQAEVQYRLLEDVLAELFPDSKVRLTLVADKLIVRGQAQSAEDAAHIMAIIRGQANVNVANSRNFASPVQGYATNVFNQEETGRAARPRIQVVNMLQVPGVQQVALRVKIAQLNRSAARGIGLDADASFNFGGGDDDGNALFVQSMLNMAAGNAPSVITQFDDANINLGLRYLQQQGVVRLLSEPTLVTLSGRPATFVSGGEFAVPTLVGSAGVNAVTTDFRAFGVIVSFLPTVLDKDRIRLQVAPEFSQINSELSQNGTFGLNTNAVTTTVEMREGQTLAIAGLLEDTMKNTRIGNVPYLERIFGTRDSARNENELIILVTPELVNPMEPEEVPPLPGFDITEPTNKEFYWHGHLEGHPTSGYRSTVWPELRRRYRAGGPAMTSGPFGHGQ